MWSLFAGFVGYIIQTIEQRVGFLGKIIGSFIGFAWSVACIFIIPTLVRDTEMANPVKLLRNSAGTLKRTWGELVVGFVSLDVALAFIVIPVVLCVCLITCFAQVHHGHRLGLDTRFVLMPMFIFFATFLTLLPFHGSKMS